MSGAQNASPFRTVSRTSHIAAVPDAVFAWHERSGALERLIPPWESVQVVERSGGFGDGARLTLRIRQGPLAFRWVAVHRDTIPGRQFVDEQVEGPLAHWIHTHRMDPAEGGGCRMTDRIEYAPPFGLLGAAAGQWCLTPQIDRMLRYRHDVLRGDLAAHGRFADRPPLRVGVTGSHGLVGSALLPFLTTGGHSTVRLVRARPGPDDVLWNPATGQIDGGALSGVDAVVHLAAESIAAGRWTRTQKRRIRESRVVGTRRLCETLARLDSPPRVLISASAVGFYGDRGDEQLIEDSSPGTGFLADLAGEWEAATEPARVAGIRVVELRLGVVLSPRGGALRTMLPPFRLGLGGQLGSGSQWMSWASIDDVIGAIHHLLLSDSIEGPINVVAPEAVTNREFTETLGQVLGRPTLLPVPQSVLRVAIGEMADEALLASARVLPARLQQSGYQFRHPSLGTALSHVLGKTEPRANSS
ncbi:MAG: TIGR01777 family protein [Gemmatimonadales bacterium]|nr:TIGR01777 family protein [Gemmatimonadales bacterium]